MRTVRAVLLSVFAMSSLCAEAASIENVFKEGKVEGQLRLAYINQDNHADATATTHATVIGGQLKYETAKFYNFSLAASAFVSQKISPLSGNNAKSELNLDMLGTNGDSFAYFGEAYVNYNNSDLNVRIGRQKIDTPLSDTDEIRMLPNTFEAVMAEYRGVKDFVFTAGHIQRWAGYDSGADISKFKDMPSISGSDGVTLVGLTNESIENVAIQAWFYDFDKQAGVTYLDAVYGTEYSSGISAETGLQYVNYDEKSSSGVDGDAYGGMLAIGYGGVTLGAAFNELDTHAGKTVTLGYGGGPFFTSMEEMTVGGMNGAEAYVFSAQVDLSKLLVDGVSLAYAHGMFNGNNGAGAATKYKENDIILAYMLNDSFDIEASYACVDDKVNSGTSDTGYDRFLARVNYRF